MYDVIVIGAGLAGILTAIELSKKYTVCLLEADEEIIPVSSSSFNECYKLIKCPVASYVNFLQKNHWFQEMHFANHETMFRQAS